MRFSSRDYFPHRRRRAKPWVIQPPAANGGERRAEEVEGSPFSADLSLTPAFHGTLPLPSTTPGAPRLRAGPRPCWVWTRSPRQALRLPLLLSHPMLPHASCAHNIWKHRYAFPFFFSWLLYFQCCLSWEILQGNWMCFICGPSAVLIKNPCKTVTQVRNGKLEQIFLHLSFTKQLSERTVCPSYNKLLVDPELETGCFDTPSGITWVH